MFPEIQTVQEDVFDDQTQQQTLAWGKSDPQQMSYKIPNTKTYLSVYKIA
jgi:hypothetical protein